MEKELLALIQQVESAEEVEIVIVRSIVVGEQIVDPDFGELGIGMEIEVNLVEVGWERVAVEELGSLEQHRSFCIYNLVEILDQRILAKISIVEVAVRRLELVIVEAAVNRLVLEVVIAVAVANSFVLEVGLELVVDKELEELIVVVGNMLGVEVVAVDSPVIETDTVDLQSAVSIGMVGLHWLGVLLCSSEKVLHCHRFLLEQV